MHRPTNKGVEMTISIHIENTEVDDVTNELLIEVCNADFSKKVSDQTLKGGAKTTLTIHDHQSFRLSRRFTDKTSRDYRNLARSPTVDLCYRFTGE